MTNNTTIYPVLREIYEKETGGAISDRQWQRIRHEYLDKQVNMVTVRTLAYLRNVNGRRSVSIKDVARLHGFDKFVEMLSSDVKGQDILDAFRLLKPTPSESTIRRWGQQLGIPLVKTRWYTAQEAQTWIRFVGDRVRFKFPDNAIKKGEK